MARYNVFGVGNALVDMEYHVTESVLTDLSIEKSVMTLIEEDRHHELTDKLNIHHHKRSCGGSAANTMIAIAQFGGKSFYSCKVADDEPGQFYLQDLKSCGVDSSALNQQLDQGTTGKCLVMVTPDSDRTMNTFLGITGELSPKELDHDAIRDSEYVYIEGYLVAAEGGKAAALEASKTAQEAGTPTALTLSDPNMVNFFRDGLLEMAGDNLELLFCNQIEAQSLSKSDNINDCIEALKSISKQFAITLGSEGSILFDGNKTIEIAPLKVQAKDTLGAGDLYAGAFLYGITHGMEFAKAGELASLASAHLVTQYGPRLTAEKNLQLLNNFIK